MDVESRLRMRTVLVGMIPGEKWRSGDLGTWAPGRGPNEWMWMWMAGDADHRSS